jgi:hypothetical protein
MTQEEFNKWADKACRYCYDKAISNEINLNFYAFQSKPLIDKQPELLILGLNPHGDDNYWNGQYLPPYEEAIDRFSKENPYFKPEKDKWLIWQGLKRVFHAENIKRMLQDDYSYMYMNVLYFNTNDINTFKNNYDKQGEVFRDSVNLTVELIQLLKPKRILCLSIVDCFNRLKDNFTDCQILIPSFLVTGRWENIPVYGIRHTSRANKGESLTGKSLQYLFEKDQQQIVSTDEFQQTFAEDIKLFKQYKPTLTKEEKEKIATSTKDLLKEKFGLTIHPLKKETLYTKNEKLYITITSTGDGYIAIRHSDCETKKSHYDQGIFYEKQEELIELLVKKYEYKEYKVWLGTKPFTDYGYDTDSISQSIVKEMEELLPSIEEIMK